MSISVTINVTGETSAEVRDNMTAILSQPLTSVSPAPDYTHPEAPTKADDEIGVRRLELAWPRLGAQIRRWLIAGAEQPDGWTNPGLASELGLEPTTLRSHAANLGRTVKAINRKLGTPDGSIYAWDDARDRYVMPEVVRRAILAKANERPTGT